MNDLLITPDERALAVRDAIGAASPRNINYIVRGISRCAPRKERTEIARAEKAAKLHLYGKKMRHVAF